MHNISVFEFTGLYLRFKAYKEDGGGVGGRGGEFLREIWKYFVGILKIHKLFPPNSNLILLALHLSEKKLSITSAKLSKQVENTAPGWSMFNKCNI